jgi:predicted dehydrogenase
MEVLKVGVIGAGKMGLLHSGIFNGLEQTKLSSISEKDKMLSSVLKRYMPKTNIYTDYEKMFKNEYLDIVVITTPVFLHKSMIESAIEQEINIFVEKPLALNSDECNSILNKNNEHKTSVGFCKRFMETYGFVKKLLDDSVLGNVNFFQSQLFVEQVFKREKGWQYDPAKSGGGVLVDLGSHVFDLFHYLFGDVKSVSGMGKKIFSESVEDYVSVNFQFKNEILGSLQLSWSMRNYRLPELKINIQLDKGTIMVTDKYVEIYSEITSGPIKSGWNTFYKQNLAKGIPLNIGGPEYTAEDLHLINCIKEDHESVCNFKEAAKTNFVIDSVYSSIKNGNVQNVGYGD